MSDQESRLLGLYRLLSDKDKGRIHKMLDGMQEGQKDKPLTAYRKHKPFDFCRDGHACRRDRDALPRVMIVDFDYSAHELTFHAAGDEFVRIARITDAGHDVELYTSLTPTDALMLGQAVEWVRGQTAIQNGGRS